MKITYDSKTGHTVIDFEGADINGQGSIEFPDDDALQAYLSEMNAKAAEVNTLAPLLAFVNALPQDSTAAAVAAALTAAGPIGASASELLVKSIPT